jgi:putative nucleotidyltransferase with HDIG domain
MSETIAVQQLQVGMFVHLDTGWMKHPFPRSSFLISTEQELAQLRALGLSELRWSPDKSSLPEPPEVASPAAAEAAATLPPPSGPSELQLQRAAARACEQRYLRAGDTLRDVLALASENPQRSRELVESLATELLRQMDGEPALAIVALSGNAGERPTAHPLNVSIISLLMARTMGLADEELQAIGVGALVHDVGKLELPHRLRYADERMTTAELNAHRDHVRLGTLQAERMQLAAAARLIVAQHHEAADGSGYPGRLNLDRMSMGSRIVSLVDRYDEMCNPGPLGRGMTPNEALGRLFAQGRGLFDVTMLNAFIRMMGVYPAGSVVQLTDDRYAIVTHVNSLRPMKPRVLVHEPAVPRDEALLLNLAEQGELGIRRSLPLQQLPEPARAYLTPPPRVAYCFEPMPSPARAGVEA